MNSFYSNGKLLLTGEYLVLEGALSLAIPTKFGQDLVIEGINQPQLLWGSYTYDGVCWFQAIFDLPKFRLVNATFQSDKEGSSEFVAETLQNVLQEAKKLNPNFLSSKKGCKIKTHLSFPRNWGLGSSSTLINNIANWAQVNPYQLLWNSFSGSGYDIACARHNSPILYQLKNNQPVIEEVAFRPTFSDQLYFVYLNQKQNSREGITRFKEKRTNLEESVREISELTSKIFKTDNLQDFEYLMQEHENRIAALLELPKVKESLFPDYFGTIKSLGAWGGDFVLVTGNENTASYFKSKGYQTIIPFLEMVL